MRKLVLIFCLSALAASSAELYDFSLLPPDGAVQGASGSTVGWGYTLHNESSSLWLITTDLNAGTFLEATPTLLFDFPILAPGASVTEKFDPASSTGLYQMTWDAAVRPGFVNTGNFTLDAQWWTGDPLAGGHFASDAPTASAGYTATVPGAAPEPGTIGLMALGLSGLLAVARRRFGGSRPERR
jgi:hypothetical protein